MKAMFYGPGGQTVLGNAPITIGSTPDNQLVLSDPSVGPRHAQVSPATDGYSIMDMGSNTGTFVNEQRLSPYTGQMLRSGDVVRVGNTRLNYQAVSDAPSAVPPTMYAPSSAQQYGSSPNYGSNPYDSTPATPPPPAPQYNPPSNPYGGFNSNPGLYGSQVPQAPVVPMGTAPVQKKGGSGLWIGLGILAVVLVVGGGLLYLFVFKGPSNTPTTTLQAYCDAVQSGDYQKAYSQYSGNALNQRGSESAFASSFTAGKPSNCTLSNVDNSAGKGTMTLQFSDYKAVYNDTLSNSNGTWKITDEQLNSPPTLTLNNYCSALKQQDYKTAYNQLSKTQHDQQTETQFEANFANAKVTDCTVSNVDDTKGTGVIDYTILGQKVTADYTLSNTNGNWLIDTEQVRTTPTMVLDDYSTDLKKQDYQSAYNLLSKSQQNQQTESQFAANFDNVTITDATVSNVDDTKGTGTITYTISGKTVVADYTLVQEGGTWKIDSETVRK